MVDPPPPASYRLANGEDANREHPRTFFIPSSSERESLEAGQLVKLVFELTDRSPEAPRAERMWVVVTGRSGGSYVGTLDNQPRHIADLHAGDLIEFGPEHVVSIWEDRPELDLKAVVSRRSHERDLRPRYVCRQEPLNARDSGWQILVGDESEEELSDSAQVLLQPLGFVLDRWPELAEPFADRAPRSEWSWDADTATYVRLAQTPVE